MPKKTRKQDTMTYKDFERKYRDEIGWEAERSIGEGPIGTQDYDVAYEAAVDAIAAAKGITLV